MADPATAAGIALAILPLIISALENYEYTFQPIIIFSSRYRREVERFQDAMKVQRVDFANECCHLLHSVTAHQGNAMIDNLRDPLWQDGELENKLKDRLDDCYDACVSALRLINNVLTEILTETKLLDILLQKRTGQIDVDWLRRLRQRSKISFSRDRFNTKLKELENRIDGLRRLCKHINIYKSATAVLEDTPTPQFQMEQYGMVQSASSKLHDTLTSLWRCEVPKEHFVNICLEIQDDTSPHHLQKIHFDLVWTCPAQTELPVQEMNPMSLSVQTFSESHPVVAHSSQISDQQSALETALESTLRLQSSHPVPIPALPRSRFTSNSNAAIPQNLRDLCTIPNLCNYLGRQVPTTRSVDCIGFLQKTKTFKHYICTPQEHIAKTSTTVTLEDALRAAKVSPDGISLPEKFDLARLLALSILRFHSTPWLNGEWRSQDVVFFGVQDLSRDPLRMPFLRARLLMQSSIDFKRMNVDAQPVPELSAPEANHPRSPIRNQLLYSLGVMLIELAYNSPLQDLQTSEDNQGDPHTLYWTATRLGEEVWRKLGHRYASAVKVCLYGALGASCEIEDCKVQQAFFDEVVRQLEKCAEAVFI